jgi:alkaline phosphatase
MDTLKTLLIITAFSFYTNVNAQETQVSKDKPEYTKQEKESYYQNRALEDAKYEQEFKAENRTKDQAFWDEQKEYEKELKRSDRKAYRAYMQGKKDAYAEHHEHCNSHCNHSDYYYGQARFYYYDYDNRPYYRTSPSRNTMNTGVRVNTPSVRLGLF